MEEKVVIQAAISPPPNSTAPRLTDPDRAAAEARRAVEAGAALVHVHARTETDGESSDPKWYARFLDLFSTSCPGVPVSFTTVKTPSLLEHVKAWQPPPHICSLNVGSDVDPWEELLSLLTVRKIGIEAAIIDDAAVDLVGKTVLETADAIVPHLLITALGEERRGAAGQYVRLRERVRAGGISKRIIAHGFGGDAAWGVVGAALAFGDDVRIGLEDSTTLPSGSIAQSNGELIESVVRLAGAMGRTPASPREFEI